MNFFMAKLTNESFEAQWFGVRARNQNVSGKTGLVISMPLRELHSNRPFTINFPLSVAGSTFHFNCLVLLPT